MASIRYVTMKFPLQLFQHMKRIQETPNFCVYRYTLRPGIIFRLPHEVMEDDICHFFLEHEVNLSNTIKTGTLTMKIQITVVPVHTGVFSGFKTLPGTYTTDWYDEEEYGYGAERFVPDYERGIKKVVPLPIGGTTNLNEYLNEILFSQCNDLDVISEYAVHLGCQKSKLKEKLVFIPAPEYNSVSNPQSSRNAFHQTQLMFDFLSNQNLQLLPSNS